MSTVLGTELFCMIECHLLFSNIVTLMQTLDLPEPTDDEIEQSRKLNEIIKQSVADAGGWIDFDQYMQLALYAPGLGYYSGGVQKFGEQGDFITSPEVSPLFAQTLANPVSMVLEKMTDAKIIEFGAGSGKLAADILLALQKKNELPEEYLIIELSAELQQRQKETIQQIVPDLYSRVSWLSFLPEKPVNAVVIANEVLDAMPVKRFSIKDKTVQLLGVDVFQQELRLSYKDAGKKITDSIDLLNIESPGHTYTSEINLNIEPWIKSISQCINRGAVYLIDYGYPRSEYYSEERHMGTFMGYYRHRSIDEPLWYPGLQDLTAFVDFTSVAEAAIENDFDVDGFTSQGNFLINAGLANIVEKTRADSEIKKLQIVQQMKTLSLPGEMGERFKVIGLSKGLEENIPGFEVRDFRYRL
ncbi:MAG: SAM-dependent methyltransferase [endosymbiont of Galathealinum brachiosum]|uniref:SAM-dependent methyltransferase n=1 Tax=endosymbiont of Galathealinum brachiosum TaxID=2200906 RepID=A0A370DDK6_9GAMM|nr:MAG: SAM-dependent methyltransferase [endosymbiont of Galathealinum brachiosum]